MQHALETSKKPQDFQNLNMTNPTSLNFHHLDHFFHDLYFTQNTHQLTRSKIQDLLNHYHFLSFHYTATLIHPERSLILTKISNIISLLYFFSGEFKRGSESSLFIWSEFYPELHLSLNHNPTLTNLISCITLNTSFSLHYDSLSSFEKKYFHYATESFIPFLETHSASINPTFNLVLPLYLQHSALSLFPSQISPLLIDNPELFKGNLTPLEWNLYYQQHLDL